MTVIKCAEVEPLGRGGGVVTTPLITRWSDDAAKIVTGMSVYPPGTGAPLHLHNCDEHVTLLEGEAEVEIDGKVTPLVPYDTTYVMAGVPHAFRNSGSGPMRILWVYPDTCVTRTFLDSGETVEHLSEEDRMG